MKPLLLSAAVLSLASAAAIGQTYTDITVTGSLDIQGNSATFGAWSDNPAVPGVTITYSEASGGANASLTNSLTRPGAVWNWQRLDGSGNPLSVMQVDSSNRLILTGTQGSGATIIIDPTGGQITINGQQVLTSGNSLAVAGNGNVGIGTTNPGQLLTIGANAYIDANGAASLNGGSTYFGAGTGNLIGTNLSGYSYLPAVFGVQNFNEGNNAALYFAQGPSGPYGQATFLRMIDTDYPSVSWQLQEYGRDGHFAVNLGGAGDIIVLNPDCSGHLAWGNINWDSSGDFNVNGDTCLAGNVGIGTNNPQATLDVNGGANFSGPVQIQPQGDLSMGQFTATPPQSQSGNGDTTGAGITASHGGTGNPILSGTPSVSSGTSGF
jgi:hypothetical protein